MATDPIGFLTTNSDGLAVGACGVAVSDGNYRVGLRWAHEMALAAGESYADLLVEDGGPRPWNLSRVILQPVSSKQYVRSDRDGVHSAQ